MCRLFLLFLMGPLSLLFSSCAGTGGSYGGPGNMGPDPSPAFRKQAIANETTGDFFYGRRYHVKKTRFWGFLRQPRKDWNTAKLVVMNERRQRVPDRLPEYGSGKTFGYDQNFEYKVYGNYSGETVYEPNSNQFLPEFVPSRFELLNQDPGWLFSPSDRYSPTTITLRPR